jgi:nicotinamide riboside transporter PnuC
MVIGTGLESASMLLVVLQAVGLWRVFEKAGRPGWESLIPIYNLLVLLEILGRSEWWLLWLLIPLVNLIFWLFVCQDLADAFGHGLVFAAGLFLLPWLFLLLLAFGDSEFRKGERVSVGRLEF